MTLKTVRTMWILTDQSPTSSPYTKRGAVVSSNYNTVSVLRTIEDLLGIGYLALRVIMLSTLALGAVGVSFLLKRKQ